MTRATRQLNSFRAKFAAACTDVLAEAATMPPLLSAQTVWAIPSDLAAHGFQVNMSQLSAGWSIEVECEIGDGWFAIEGTGKSMLQALNALAEKAAQAFAKFESLDDSPEAA